MRREEPWTLGPAELGSADALTRETPPSLAVVVPARDEARTLGPILGAVYASNLVDEVVVVDDGSRDDTADVARAAGARVLELDGRGKGAAMAAGLAATTSELVVFLDGDVTSPVDQYVARLAYPLVVDEDVQLVKGYYERPLGEAPLGGGRVTELTARPILSLLHPALAGLYQPLAGETAARREALSAIEFEPGYAVEIGLLIDVARKFGPGSLAQVDLGVRRHRNRSLDELGPMARDVLRAVLERSGVALRAD